MATWFNSQFSSSPMAEAVDALTLHFVGGAWLEELLVVPSNFGAWRGADACRDDGTLVITHCASESAPFWPLVT